jgi:RimJ/RimL family protein N-acetyltransferase
MIELPIVGKGMVIDRLALGDAPGLSASHSDPENARYQGWQSPLSESEARAFIEAFLEAEPLADGAGTQLAIREEIGGPLVGDLYLVRASDPPGTVEVGITLLPSFQRRGLATATIRAVVAAVLGTEISGTQVQRIVGVVDVENQRSRALFERLGFRLEAHHELSGRRRDGAVADELMYVVTDAASSAGTRSRRPR